MNKSSKNNNPEQAISEKFSLSRANKMEIEACTNNAQLSSFGGLALLRKEEAYLDLSHQLASCIKDKRTKYLVRHSLEELIMTRIFQICLGYEDVNDCDRTRKGPMLQMAVHNGEFDRDICSSATMCRFENSVTEEDLVAIQEMFVTLFILSYRGKAPAHIILDCDDTNVDTYGTQEGVLFNAYYDSREVLKVYMLGKNLPILFLPLETKHYFCPLLKIIRMNDYPIRLILMKEAREFLSSLPIKVKEKIAFNYSKILNGFIDNEIFKKLDNSNIWEFRTLYNGNCYRLFAFWDTETGTLILATHGIVKKTQKTPTKEIAKAEEIRKRYFEAKRHGKD